MRKRTQDTIRRTRSIPLSKAIDPNTKFDDEVEDVPFTGYTEGAHIGWPDSTSQAVGIRLEEADTGTRVFPTGDDQFVSFDGLTDFFSFTHEFEEGESIKAVFQNNKGQLVAINCIVRYKELFIGEEV